MTVEEVEACVRTTGRAPIDIISDYCRETGESFADIAGAYVFVTVIEQAGEKLDPDVLRACAGRASDITLAWIEMGNERTPHANVIDAPDDAREQMPYIFGQEVT